MRRIIPSKRKRTQPPGDSTAPHSRSRLDIWLLRASHISQFGLLLLTVGGLYFTVIPLYQKALLDEAIARKEVELLQTQYTLERIYMSVRSLSVREFTFFASGDCSGIRGAQEAIARSAGKRGIRPGTEDRLLGIPVRTCLIEVFEKSRALNELRDSDRKALRVEVERVASSLDAARIEAIAEYDRQPSIVAANPDAISLKANNRARILEIMAPLRPAAETQAQRIELLALQAQEEIVRKYHGQLLSSVVAIRELAWPDNQGQRK